MTGKKSDDGGKDEKAERLAERLRENLKRRRRGEDGNKPRAIKNDETH